MHLEVDKSANNINNNNINESINSNNLLETAANKESKERFSFAFAIFFNFFLTAVCLSLTIICFVYIVQRYFKRKEERDKLCSIISARYWVNENNLIQSLQILIKMKDVVLYQDVSAYTVFCYKYRSGQFKADPPPPVEAKFSSCDGRNSYNDGQQKSGIDLFVALKKIEQLFDSLNLQLMCEGKCSDTTARILGPTIFHFARETSLAWNDLKSPLVHKLVTYFSGHSCAEIFRSCLLSDASLTSLILNRVPYVNDLVLSNNLFVLRDIDSQFVEAANNNNRINVRNKIRYVDVVLSKEIPVNRFESREKQISDACVSAKEFCVKYRFVAENAIKNEGNSLGSCVVLLRHMIRLMCHKGNLKKVSSDDKFFNFLLKLHEALYNWLDTASMLEVLDRTRNNILRFVNELVTYRIIDSRDVTKKKLEQIEKDLYEHLNYLTVQQVQKEGELASLQSSRNKQWLLHQVESNMSIYTMARSSCYTLKSQSNRNFNMRHISSNPEHLERGSLLSNTSLYATANSLSSHGGDGSGTYPRNSTLDGKSNKKKTTSASSVAKFPCSPSSLNSDAPDGDNETQV